MDVVFPCLNEVAALPWVLARMPASSRAIVVDNGSTDGSAARAIELGALVVPCLQRGYGAACHTGLEAASAEFVAVCDCDGTVDPGAARDMTELLDTGVDLVVGRRRPVTRGAWPLSARIANKELARRIRRRTGLRISDVGPLRVGRRTALLDLNLKDRRSGYPVETIVEAARAGWRIEQINVSYYPRIGTSKVTGTVRGSVQAVRDMSRTLRT